MPKYIINWKYSADGHYDHGDKSYKSISAARKAITKEIENRWDVFSGTVAVSTFLGYSPIDGKKMVSARTVGEVKLRKFKTGLPGSFIYTDYTTRKTYVLNKDGSLGRKV